MSKKNSKKAKRVKIHSEIMPPQDAPAAETAAPQTETPCAETPCAETPAEAPKAAKGKKTPKAKKEPKPRKPGILTIAAGILKDAKKAMTTKEIVEQALAKGLWETKGRTPSATLYSALLREIANKGDKSRFGRAEKHGQFVATAKA